MIQNNSVEDIKPQFESITKTRASAPVGAWTYNEAGYTYNQAGLVYGGADNTTDIGPQLEVVDNITPVMYEILDL